MTSASSEVVERSWDLSLYELHRVPQEAITDSSVSIAVSARCLQSELTCPICLDMLTQTMTTKECLHRFCSECIVTALRSGNKECPTCRKKLVSKRSLRPDPNFDRLVEKIFPNREEYEAHQESIMESLNRSHSQNFITSIKDGIKAQMAHAKAMNRKSKSLATETPGDHNTPIIGGQEDYDNNDDNDHVVAKRRKKQRNVVDEGANSDSSQSGVQEVEIVFKFHPKMIKNAGAAGITKENSTRYIKTTAKALVEHLCRYLAMRISLDRSKGVKSETTSTTASITTATPTTSTTTVPTTLPGPSSEQSTSSSSLSSVRDLSVYIAPTPGQMIELPTTMALAEVNEKYWKVNKPMEMFYSFSNT